MGRGGSGVTAATANSIEITFQYNGKRCRERIPLPPTAANLKRAEQHRANILYEISRGTFDYAQVFPNSKRLAMHARVPGDALLCKRYLTEWYANRKQGLAASTGREWYATVNNLLIPAFGNTPLSQLTKRSIKRWLQDLDMDRVKPLSNKRLANIQTVLRSALGDAVEDELIEVNVMAGYTYSRELPYDEHADGASADPFNTKEQAAILDACPHPEFRNMIHFAFWTGLRTSELVALNWADVDWMRGEIMVRRALTRAAKGKAETTKTRAGRRMVKLLPPALDALRAQELITGEANEIIFNNPTIESDKPTRWTGDGQIWRVWQNTIKVAKVRYRNPYQTRHTYASMMLSSGEHPMWVAQQMGHSGTVMIMRVYGRWMPDADLSAGHRAVEKFSSRTI